MATMTVTTRTVDPAGYTAGALTITAINVEQPGVNATPAAVWFEVADVTGSDAGAPTGVREPKFHDITYVWDFGDAANATPSNAAALNMPAVWKNINTAKGKRVAHVYNDPGTYTVRCTVYERNSRKMGALTTTVTIADPRAVFTGNRTIIFNPNSIDITPYGYTGAQNLTTWGAVLTARNALGATTAQILFAPGAELVNTQMCNNPSWGNIRFGALDPTQPKPVIRDYVAEGNNLIRDEGTANIERVVFGLRFQGEWDSTTETGRIVDPFRTLSPTTTSTYLMLHHRCEFDGWGTVGSISGTTPAFTSYVVHSELNITNWQDFGMTTAGDNAAVISCSVPQHPDALSGGDKTYPFYNWHSSLRDFNAGTLYIAIFDAFGRNGWSVAGAAADGLATTAVNATLRVNTNGETGRRGNIERAVVEGMISFRDEADQNVPGNYVMDGVIQIMASRNLQEGVEIRHGGVTVRNMLAVVANVPSYQSNRPGRLFFLSNNGGAVDNDTGIELYQNTFIDLRNNANANNGVTALKADDTPAFSIQTVENNVFEQPNRSPAIVPDAPVDLATSIGVTPRDKGVRYGFQRLQFSLISAVPPGGDLIIPYSWIRRGRYAPNAYSTGTVAVTNGSTAVNGTGTVFNQNGLDWTGAAFRGPDLLWYPVASMNSATSLTLATPYRGTTTSGTYALSLYTSGAVTDQAYWQANGGPRGKMDVAGVTYHRGIGFQVFYEASQIRINNLSGATWAANALVAISLDRRGALPAFDPQYDIRGVTIPTGRPQAGSAANNAATSGKRAVLDLFGTIRPTGSGDERGATLA